MLRRHSPESQLTQPLLALFAMFLVIVLAGCGNNDGRETGESSSSEPAYVGAAVCADCHREQADLWNGSHHELAMQPVNEVSVLGAFDDAEFSHQGVTSRFITRDGEYLVKTDGQDGQLAEFPVRYTFGVEPLQQYLLELPGGRIQTLGVSWDSRSEAEGGQRWFHVYGDESIDHNDVLHWTRLGQNWDSMCAYCHSTGLKKTFDEQTQAFDTSWAEINVACEACHGPGSMHVDWANTEESNQNNKGSSNDHGFTVRFDERDGVRWLLDPDSGNSRRDRSRTTQLEIETCAACHSRRSQIGNQPRPGDELLDNFRPALLASPLYHVDGQIRDEVYVYGSFMQSRMHQQGVTCSDCHDPHSLKLRAPGPQVCLQCHSADKFAATEHHLHAAASDGADCIECHMPPTTYMQVDPRHDHSFRIPRPDLSIEFDTPNACTNCHADKSAEWAAGVLRANDKLPDEGHWQEKLAIILSAQAGASGLILELSEDQTVPAIVRASVIVQAQRYADAALMERLAGLAGSADPLIRWAVARLIQAAPAPIVAEPASALLEDSVKAVRIEAANALAPVALELLPAHAQGVLQSVLDEYIEAELVNNERAEAHVNIGNLQRSLRRPEKSEHAYRTALGLNSFFVPAYVNLADLFRAQEREKDGESLLREGVHLLPEQPSLHYALGLSLYRQGRAGEARDELLVAAESPDAEPSMALAYALIIDAQGEADAAIEYLNGSLERFGDDPGLLAALINLYQRTNQRQAAEPLIQRLRNP